MLLLLLQLLACVILDWNAIGVVRLIAAIVGNNMVEDLFRRDFNIVLVLQNNLFLLQIVVTTYTGRLFCSNMASCCRSVNVCLSLISYKMIWLSNSIGSSLDRWMESKTATCSAVSRFLLLNLQLL